MFGWLGYRPAPLLCFLIMALFFIYASEGSGGMRMEPFNGLDHVISLDCFTVMVPSAFVGLSLYDFQNPKDALVSFNYRTNKCNTHEILGTCHGGKNVSINAVIKDLSEGETRTYGCNATYDNRLSYKTETYTVNVTRPQSSVLTSAVSTSISAKAKIPPSSISSFSWFTTDAVSPTRTGSVSGIYTRQSGTTVNSTQSSLSDTMAPDKIHTPDVGITVGASATFVVTVGVVVIWIYRRRSGKLNTYAHSQPSPHSPAHEQEPADNPPEMLVNYHPAEASAEVTIVHETATRPLPRRPTSIESDYQELPDPQSADNWTPHNTSWASAAALKIQADGPYSDVKDSEMLLEKDQEKTEEERNDSEIPMLAEEQPTTFRDSEAGATAPDYVPLRDIAERKERAGKGKAKRATVI